MNLKFQKKKEMKKTKWHRQVSVLNNPQLVKLNSH